MGYVLELAVIMRAQDGLEVKFLQSYGNAELAKLLQTDLRVVEGWAIYDLPLGLKKRLFSPIRSLNGR